MISTDDNGMWPVAYLGFPAPGNKVSFGAPRSFRGSIDVESEVGVKGRRQLTRAPHIFVSRRV